mmetsp:Transcript_115552/g.359888  ORF Transcript_115552/g.359888 Transcript_115552/m.359888 type:complete len:272 (-) Transcript_115552:668-1483(-)
MYRRLCRFWTHLAVAGALRLGEDKNDNKDCTCLNWAQVYRSGIAQCGEGLELLGLALNPQVSMAGPAFSRECGHQFTDVSNMDELMRTLHAPGRCGEDSLRNMDFQECNDDYKSVNTSFFRFQEHDLCVKAAPMALPKSPLHSTNWCYVSSKCRRLNGGVKVNDNVSVKTCTLGIDKFLGDLPVRDLCGLQNNMRPQALGHGSCLSAAFKAYNRGAGLWQDVLKKQPGFKNPKIRATFWKDPTADRAVVQQGTKRWEIFWDWKEENCIGGC